MIFKLKKLVFYLEVFRDKLEVQEPTEATANEPDILCSWGPVVL